MRRNAVKEPRPPRNHEMDVIRAMVGQEFRSILPAVGTSSAQVIAMTMPQIRTVMSCCHRAEFGQKQTLVACTRTCTFERRLCSWQRT